MLIIGPIDSVAGFQVANVASLLFVAMTNCPTVTKVKPGPAKPRLVVSTVAHGLTQIV
jgi:hypothetical protein